MMLLRLDLIFFWGVNFRSSSWILPSEAVKEMIKIAMNRAKQNHRLLEVKLDVEVKLASGKFPKLFSKKYFHRVRMERNETFFFGVILKRFRLNEWKE
ncbi:protein arginine N-methyltransferase PRMT10-like [Amaranthus tricolor]|uniref:protein arginine N-methyltransferase PRMT10-like n=1 Tax=Amaranthus tricolor TaxID=29722 RepID=UPI00258C3F8B|nr:protein arginine N-methyltransferase PRMT10-like [Amaranthus tricolor]